MIRYLTAVKNLFSKTHKIEDVEPEQELPDSYIAKDECSANIEFRLDRFTGDFNILVEVNQTDEDTSETLGLLLHLINTGSLKGFFAEAYSNWAGDDVDRQEFLTNMYLSWVRNEETFSDEYEKLAVKPSSVFGLNNQQH
jgi:hypothetical protein|tara:strand:- start:1321 stop:1740 length:420 start_codon:yes stop_codon:yes gene_type:complete